MPALALFLVWCICVGAITMRVRNRRRDYTSQNERRIRNDDLIPLSTALEMLSEWYGRKYTLADFQLAAIQSHVRCTPVFPYTGKGVVFNPHYFATDDLLEKFDGWIPDRWYESYFNEWWHSEQDIMNLNNAYFCLDFGGLLGVESCVLNDFTVYLTDLQAKQSVSKIRPALYISGARINTGEFMVMPVVDYPVNQPVIKPKDIEPNFNLGFYDWYIPLKQVEALNPNYKFIWKVNNKYYIHSHYENGDSVYKKIKLSDYDSRFYTLLEADFTSLDIQLLALANSNNATNTNIGHNQKSKDRRQKAHDIAKQIWKIDHKQLIKAGDMVYILRSLMPELKEIQTDQTIRRYFSDLRPDYAMQGGTPINKTTTETKHKNEYINDLIKQYSNQSSKTE